MSANIGQQDWMTDPACRAVIAALEAAGGEGCARFVGGCVRNTLLKKPVDDVDIATVLTPDKVREALHDAGLKAVPTGVEHGTITAVSSGRPFEVTTLRRDVETDGRRAVVAFTTDWAEDAQRRDFRLNAVYADARGDLYDPTGKGVADARAGRIVFVGDPMLRIREDYLRILRFFRFYAWYGKGEPDGNAVAACRALKSLLQGRAAERTQKELLKLLGADDPRPAVRLMADTGVLGAILPQAADFARFEALVEIEKSVLHENEPLLRLAALLPADPKVAALTAEQLRLSNAQRDRLVAAAGAEPKITSWMSQKQGRRRVYQFGVQGYFDRVKLAWAASARSKAASQWRALLALGEDFTRPELPVSGADVTEAGVPKGPKVGAVLREVEEWWVDHDFPADRDLALDRMRAVVQGLAE